MTTDKNPLELAIAAVETCTRHGGLTDYQTYTAKIAALRQGQPSDVDDRIYLDQALRILIDAGYMRRHHTAPGRIAYGPTPTWRDRDAVLGNLRYRKPSPRPWRIRHAQKRRLEREENRRIELERRAAVKAEERQARKDAKRKMLIETRGLTPSGKIRRKSRAASMIARGELPLPASASQLS